MYVFKTSADSLCYVSCLRLRIATQNNTFLFLQQVRFDTLTTIYQVQTQSRADYPQFITKYKLSTSQDCVTFTPYKEGGVVKVRTRNIHLTRLPSVLQNTNTFNAANISSRPTL